MKKRFKSPEKKKRTEDMTKQTDDLNIGPGMYQIKEFTKHVGVPMNL